MTPIKMNKALLYCCFILLLTQSSTAQTYVSGSISSSATWTSALSPYIVTDTVFVLPGASLHIEPGVNILFDSNTALYIKEAKIIAEGNTANEIIFTANTGSPSKDYWAGIIIEGGKQVSSFRHTRIMYASSGIHFLSDTTLNIAQSRLCFNTIAITSGDTLVNATINLDSCSIDSNFWGIYHPETPIHINASHLSHNNSFASFGGVGVPLSSADYSTIHNTVIDSNSTGLLISACKMTQTELSTNYIGSQSSRYNTYDSCTFRKNYTALESAFDSVSHCSFTENLNGLRFAANSYIGYNKFTKNGISIVFTDSTSGEISHNNFAFNDTAIAFIKGAVNIRFNTLDSNSDGIQLLNNLATVHCNKFCSKNKNVIYEGLLDADLSNNYWCTDDSSTIQGTIADGLSSPGFGNIHFMPLDKDSCFLDKPLGISTPSASSSGHIQCYPNPFSLKTTIRFDNPEHVEHSLKVYNTNGKQIILIEHNRSNKIELSRKDLANGIYFYQLSNSTQVIGSGQLMVQ